MDVSDLRFLFDENKQVHNVLSNLEKELVEGDYGLHIRHMPRFILFTACDDRLAENAIVPRLRIP